ncbi:1-acyl-sn-glycerol-3-phosphate acyltransferase [Corallococcus sp. H22C18031201]|uniref:lysophospholipid acyltransferase family protein n=1 Tax=Citreicoccus inhibens TaxID=2849499 RepID=UPI000E7492BA|nr:lysophospholipid acyltransferase family protein [Citreicoccus inhibens]MBU8897436.1 1-acyl-sn-glycerol-3-phosphate acyltransferase [Citreicoccus inhibens]RJS16786.1 1-acyl-sn-glycerol-3-phosphate acyltransferase [Corallococcus sp. H22C18031201]
MSRVYGPDPPSCDTVRGAIGLLFSIAFWAFFGLSSAVLFLGAVLVWLVTLPFDRNGRVLHLYSCFWAQLYVYVNPLWRLRIEGREHLPWRGAAVLVANHESLGDVLVLFGLYRPFKWVSKAENFKLPFIGWNMRLNRYVPLVRGDKESIGRMMAQCEAWLLRGVPILMFPEGTRSADGNVKAFKDGAFTLAVQQGCPVIPIVVTGTARTLPKHGLVMRTPARCQVRVLSPVDPAAFQGDVHALRDAVRERIIAEKARMVETEPPH